MSTMAALTPEDWKWLIVYGVGILGSVGAAVWKLLSKLGDIVYRLGKQDGQIEWANRVLEEVGKKTNSLVPPREKLVTLNSEALRAPTVPTDTRGTDDKKT